MGTPEVPRARNTLIGLILILALGECILRWGIGLGDPPLARFDTETEYELIPSVVYQRWGNTISINAFGMRSNEHPATPAPQDRHILLIGDSVVYGGHFLDQSETIAAQLGEMLHTSDHFVDCTIRILPMAVSSWGPVNQTAFLNKHGSFGAVTAGIIVSAHDLYDVPRANSDILPYRTSSPKTAIGDALKAVIERFFQASSLEPVQPRSVRAALSLAALEEMVRLLELQNTRPVLIYHPTANERAGNERVARQTFRDWALHQRIVFLDLGDIPVERGDYSDAIHPAPSGAKKLARAIAPELSKDLQGCGN